MKSILEQLSSMTVVVADTGDLDCSSTTTRTTYFGSFTGKDATKLQTFLLVFEPFKAF